ncbi:phosphoenolpyruvate--protein phosphotransferase [Kerstersia gyiorum]|jgi:phosphotransferase system enzyme I (PtsI)|uniref:phosphoenolpyruvate--protein phosphotransferase n=1 Tax=Kerstersia gyiorum TaxID=206506 RepID=UPI00242DC069|nr:phosphoenolpyruvate--protein phosphotransferase [Kerstersia gyiorum]
MTSSVKSSRPEGLHGDSVFTLHGLAAARGYAIGRAVVMGAATLEVAHYRIAPEDVDGECRRLEQALHAVREELEGLIRSLPDDAPKELAALLNVHVLLVSDRMLSEHTCVLIAERHYNAEWALTVQGQIFNDQFAAMQDEYLRERGADIRQVIERVIRVLSGWPALFPLDEGRADAEPLVVFANDISPADMIRLRGGRFAAFVTDLGGATSHTAIVARSLGVPAVVAASRASELVRDGDSVIVDGADGVIIVNPTDTIEDEYRALQQRHAEQRAALSLLLDESAVTLDGVSVVLNANLELPDEAQQALAAGADGIGLFRSEFLFMGRSELPNEEEQYEAYASVARMMDGRPVTIRTLDLGADKELDGEHSVALNPALGRRAIRYCLARPDMFATQLRAILRASAHGNVRIMIPMVSNLAEVRAVKLALNDVRAELRERGQAFSDDIPLGAMVEVPAMALALEPFADELDFFSIGTNDLIQYTLAIDRGDNDVANLYDPLHPAVLRLIAQVINAADRFGKPVAVCGEMAGDPALTRLLLGLGLREFSMDPQRLLEVKREIRNAHTQALRVQVAAVLNRAATIDLEALRQNHVSVTARTRK